MLENVSTMLVIISGVTLILMVIGLVVVWFRERNLPSEKKKRRRQLRSGTLNKKHMYVMVAVRLAIFGVLIGIVITSLLGARERYEQQFESQAVSQENEYQSVRTLDDENNISLNKQAIKNAEGEPILHIDIVQKTYKDWRIAHGQASEPELRFEFSNVIVSPDKTKIAFSANSTPEEGASLSFVYYLQTEELLYLDSEIAALSWWWPNEPTFWSPNSRYLIIHTVGFERENSEIIFDTEERKIVSSIFNNLSMKEVVSWSSNDTVDYIEKDTRNYNKVRYSHNIHTGQAVKISETPYPLPRPQIIRAYMSQHDGPGKVAVYWTADNAGMVRVYWALDKNGPWTRHKDIGYWYFDPPEVGADKIFYRLVTFSVDGREGPPSEIIEGNITCCWKIEF